MDRVLVITPRTEEVPKLLARLVAAGFSFSRVETVTTLFDGFQRHVERVFSLCLIDESIGAGLPEFFVDMKRLGRTKSCFYVAIRDDGTRIDDAKVIGFHTVISWDVKPEERERLRGLKTVEEHLRDLEVKVRDVNDTVRLLLREVDSTAKSRKRGKAKRISGLFKLFAESNVAFDKDILIKYYEELISASGRSVPFRPVFFRIPEEVLAKALPELVHTQWYAEKALKQKQTTETKE